MALGLLLVWFPVSTRFFTARATASTAQDKTMVKQASFTSFTLLLLSGITGAFFSDAHADTRTYEATTDFPVIDAGVVPYYSEAPGRPSLAINAAIESHRDVFARAEVVYDGNEGVHDFTLVALAELDGEADYQLLINGVVVGTATNPEVVADFTVVRHTFADIFVPVGATLAIESLANTNGKIPEGDETAFARGRWTALEMLEIDDEQDPVALTPMDIDLDLTLASNKQDLKKDDDFELTLTLANADNSITATQPVVAVTLALQQLFVISADQCTQTTDQLTCSFPEIAPGESHSLTLFLINDGNDSPITVQASADADQTDRDGTNNSVSISIDVVAEEVITTIETPDTTNTTGTTDTSDNTDTDTDTDADTTSTSSSSGALSLYWLLLIVPASIRYRTRQR